MVRAEGDDVDDDRGTGDESDEHVSDGAEGVMGRSVVLSLGAESVKERSVVPSSRAEGVQERSVVLSSSSEREKLRNDAATLGSRSCSWSEAAVATDLMVSSELHRRSPEEILALCRMAKLLGRAWAEGGLALRTWLRV